MYKLTTAASKSSAPLKAVALAFVSVCLGLTGCATPRTPDRAGRPQDPAQVIADLADYAARLARQPDAQLQAEQRRLQAQEASPDRDLRLALLHGQRNSTTYDPQLASRLLIQIATSEPKNSLQGQVAQVLFAGQPDPQACADAERLSLLYSELSTQLNETQGLQRSVEEQLAGARAELEAERTERTRLEKQLKALKSLEAQIKGRDNVNN